MAEEKKKDFKDELTKIAVVAGVTTCVGAVCYAIGHATGHRLMTADELIMRAKIFDAKRDGQSVMHWVGPKGEEASFLIKYITESITK